MPAIPQPTPIRCVLKPAEPRQGWQLKSLNRSAFADITQAENLQGLSADSRSVLAVPIQYGVKLMGILNIESPLVKTFSDADVEIVDALAG